MKTLATLATAALLTFPSLAAAACDWHDRTAQMSCAEGLTYDAETKACVPQTS